MAPNPFDRPIPPTRMLVIVRIVDQDRLAKAATGLLAECQRISNGEAQLAFSSAKGETFGIFIKVERPAGAVRAGIEHTCLTRPEDHILIMELGRDFSANGGNSRGWQWLQHH